MSAFVTISFGPWEHRLFAPEIDSYVEILLKRIVPIFDDVDGEQERISNEVLSSSCWGPDDYDQAMEAAYETGIDKALQFMEMRSVFLAAGVSGLFHLFEKQIYKHLNRELRNWLVSPIINWNDARSVIEPMIYEIGTGRTKSEKLQKVFFDPNIKELRLVANSVKHGGGHSFKELKRMNAVVVSESRLEGDWTVGPYSVLGVNVAILPEDVIRYRDAILRFWKVEGTFGAPLSAFKQAQ